MNERMDIAARCEAATSAELRRLSYDVESYGQAMLTDAARQMLRGIPTPERWIADFLVTRRPVFGPRVPAVMGTKKVLLVDAKYAREDTGNHSIEMRSILAAIIATLPTYFVCSQWTGSHFSAFGVIHHRQVLRGRYRPCCEHCGRTLKTAPSPMFDLPDYCPAQARTRTASATPYVIISKTELQPLTNYVFDLGLDREPMAVRNNRADVS